MNSCAITANISSPDGAGDTPNVDLIEDNLPTDLLECLTHSTSLTFNLFTCIGSIPGISRKSRQIKFGKK